MSAVPWILGAVALVIVGQLLLKLGMRAVGRIDSARARSPLALAKRVATTPQVVVGFTVYGVSALVWVYVLSRTDLSFAYPFLALAYAGVTVAATVLLKERLGRGQWLGLVLVVAGVALVAASG